MITLAGLHIYPVKSCRGIALDSATLTVAGLAHDREWMVVDAGGRFLTQREEPRMAVIETALSDESLRLSAADAGSVDVPLDHRGDSVETKVWSDRCRGIEQGEDASRWISGLLGREVRLLRFDSAQSRHSDRAWTGGVDAQTRFSDGFALLAISQASLDDLNARLEVPLPMDRFRPNLVLDGLPAYGEDSLRDIGRDAVLLRAIKPCTRCIVTTTDQTSGARVADEPLKTLKTYRWDRDLRGVAFGQNLIVLSGAGTELRTGQQLDELRSS